MAATFPRPDPAGGWTGRAAAQPPHRVGRVSARRPEGRVGRGPPAGGTRTGAPFPRPLDRQRKQRRECPPGTPFYFGWIKADRPAGQTAGGSPPPPLGKVHFVGNFQLSRGDNTGALPLYPAVSHQSGLKV